LTELDQNIKGDVSPSKLFDCFTEFTVRQKIILSLIWW